MRFCLVKAHADQSSDFGWDEEHGLTEESKCIYIRNFMSFFASLSISADTTNHFYFYLTPFCYIFFYEPINSQLIDKLSPYIFFLVERPV